MPLTISGLITLLVELVILGLIMYAVNWFIGTLTLPQPIKTIILVLIGLIGVIVLLNTLGLTHILL